MLENEKFLQKECIGIVGIPYTTNKTKVCELMEMATGISITPDSLEACHRLPSDQSDKLIISFQEEQILK